MEFPQPVQFRDIRSAFRQPETQATFGNLNLSEFSTLLNTASGTNAFDSGTNTLFGRAIKEIPVALDAGLDTTFPQFRPFMGSVGATMANVFGASEDLGRELGEESAGQFVDFLPQFARAIPHPAAQLFGRLGTGLLTGARSYEQSDSPLHGLTSGAIATVVPEIGEAGRRATLGAINAASKKVPLLSTLGLRGGTQLNRNTAIASTLGDRIAGYLGAEIGIEAGFEAGQQVADLLTGQGLSNPFTKDNLTEMAISELPFMLLDLPELAKPSTFKRAVRSAEKTGRDLANAEENVRATPRLVATATDQKSADSFVDYFTKRAKAMEEPDARKRKRAINQIEADFDPQGKPEEQAQAPVPTPPQTGVTPTPPVTEPRPAPPTAADLPTPPPPEGSGSKVEPETTPLDVVVQAEVQNFQRLFENELERRAPGGDKQFSRTFTDALNREPKQASEILTAGDAAQEIAEASKQSVAAGGDPIKAEDVARKIERKVKAGMSPSKASREAVAEASQEVAAKVKRKESKEGRQRMQEGGHRGGTKSKIKGLNEEETKKRNDFYNTLIDDIAGGKEEVKDLDFVVKDQMKPYLKEKSYRAIRNAIWNWEQKRQAGTLRHKGNGQLITTRKGELDALRATLHAVRDKDGKADPKQRTLLTGADGQTKRYETLDEVNQEIERLKDGAAVGESFLRYTYKDKDGNVTGYAIQKAIYEVRLDEAQQQAADVEAAAMNNTMGPEGQSDLDPDTEVAEEVRAEKLDEATEDMLANVALLDEFNGVPVDGEFMRVIRDALLNGNLPPAYREQLEEAARLAQNRDNFFNGAKGEKVRLALEEREIESAYLGATMTDALEVRGDVLYYHGKPMQSIPEKTFVNNLRKTPGLKKSTWEWWKSRHSNLVTDGKINIPVLRSVVENYQPGFELIVHGEPKIETLAYATAKRRVDANLSAIRDNLQKSFGQNYVNVARDIYEGMHTDATPEQQRRIERIPEEFKWAVGEFFRLESVVNRLRNEEFGSALEVDAAVRNIRKEHARAREELMNMPLTQKWDYNVVTDVAEALMHGMDREEYFEQVSYLEPAERDQLESDWNANPEWRKAAGAAVRRWNMLQEFPGYTTSPEMEEWSALSTKLEETFTQRELDFLARPDSQVEMDPGEMTALDAKLTPEFEEDLKKLMELHERFTRNAPANYQNFTKNWDYLFPDKYEEYNHTTMTGNLTFELRAKGVKKGGAHTNREDTFGWVRGKFVVDPRDETKMQWLIGQRDQGFIRTREMNRRIRDEVRRVFRIDEVQSDAVQKWKKLETDIKLFSDPDAEVILRNNGDVLVRVDLPDGSEETFRTSRAELGLGPVGSMSDAWKKWVAQFELWTGRRSGIGTGREIPEEDVRTLLGYKLRQALQTNSITQTNYETLAAELKELKRVPVFGGKEVDDAELRRRIKQRLVERAKEHKHPLYDEWDSTAMRMAFMEAGKRGADLAVPTANTAMMTQEHDKRTQVPPVSDFLFPELAPMPQVQGPPIVSDRLNNEISSLLSSYAGGRIGSRSRPTERLNLTHPDRPILALRREAGQVLEPFAGRTIDDSLAAEVARSIVTLPSTQERTNFARSHEGYVLSGINPDGTGLLDDPAGIVQVPITAGMRQSLGLQVVGTVVDPTAPDLNFDDIWQPSAKREGTGRFAAITPQQMPGSIPVEQFFDENKPGFNQRNIGVENKFVQIFDSQEQARAAVQEYLKNFAPEPKQASGMRASYGEGKLVVDPGDGGPKEIFALNDHEGADKRVKVLRNAGFKDADKQIVRGRLHDAASTQAGDDGQFMTFGRHKHSPLPPEVKPPQEGDVAVWLDFTEDHMARLDEIGENDYFYDVDEFHEQTQAALYQLANGRDVPVTDPAAIEELRDLGFGLEWRRQEPQRVELPAPGPGETTLTRAEFNNVMQYEDWIVDTLVPGQGWVIVEEYEAGAGQAVIPEAVGRQLGFQDTLVIDQTVRETGEATLEAAAQAQNMTLRQELLDFIDRYEGWLVGQEGDTFFVQRPEQDFNALTEDVNPEIARMLGLQHGEVVGGAAHQQVLRQLEGPTPEIRAWVDEHAGWETYMANGQMMASHLENGFEMNAGVPTAVQEHYGLVPGDTIGATLTDAYEAMEGGGVEADMQARVLNAEALVRDNEGWVVIERPNGDLAMTPPGDQQGQFGHIPEDIPVETAQDLQLVAGDRLGQPSHLAAINDLATGLELPPAPIADPEAKATRKIVLRDDSGNATTDMEGVVYPTRKFIMGANGDRARVMDTVNHFGPLDGMAGDLLRKYGVPEPMIEASLPIFRKLHKLFEMDNVSLSELLNDDYGTGSYSGLATSGPEGGPVRRLWLDVVNGPYGQIKGKNRAERLDSQAELRTKELVLIASHEAAHTFEHAYRLGQLDEEQTRAFKEFVERTDNMSAEDAKLTLELFRDTYLPKEWRDLNSVRDMLNNDAAFTGKELRATLQAFWSVSQTVKPGDLEFGVTLQMGPIRRFFHELAKYVRKVTGAVFGAHHLQSTFRKPSQQAKLNTKAVNAHFDAMLKASERAELNVAEVADLGRIGPNGYGLLRTSALKVANGKINVAGLRDLSAVMAGVDLDKQGVWNTVSRWFDDFVMTGDQKAASNPAIAPFIGTMHLFAQNAKTMAKRAIKPIMGQRGADGQPRWDKKGVNKESFTATRSDQNPTANQALSEWFREQNEGELNREIPVVSWDELPAKAPRTWAQISRLNKSDQEAVRNMHKWITESHEILHQEIGRANELAVKKRLSAIVAALDRKGLWDAAPELSERIYDIAKVLNDPVALSAKQQDIAMVSHALGVNDERLRQIFTSVNDYITNVENLKANLAKRPGFTSEIRTGKFFVRWRETNGETGGQGFDTRRQAQLYIEKNLKPRGAEVLGAVEPIKRGTQVKYNDEVLQVLEAERDKFNSLVEALPLDDQTREVLKRQADVRSEVERQRAATTVTDFGQDRKLAPGREHLDMVATHLAYIDIVSRAVNRKVFDADVAYNRLNPALEDFPEDAEWVERAIGNFLTPDTEFGRNMSKANLAYFVASNLSSHIVELSQPLSSFVPEMIARGQGYFDANKLLAKAQAETGKFTVKNMKNPTDQNRNWSSPEYEKLMDALAESELISLAHASDQIGSDVAAAIDMSSIQATGKILTPAQKATQPIKHLADFTINAYRMTTEHNARVAGIVGYELAKRDGLTGDAAIESAKDFVRTVTFAGGKANRPIAPFSGKTPGWKTAGQLYYSLSGFTYNMLGMMKRYAENGYTKKLYPDWSAPERRAARKALNVFVTHQFAAAGALGLPFVGAALALLGQFTNLTPEEDIRELISGMFGEDEATGSMFQDIIMRGAANAFLQQAGLPIDLGARLSMNGILGTNSYDGWRASDMMGPTAGLISNVFAGVQAGVQEGNWGRAAEEVLPVGVKKMVNLARNEGELRDDRGNLLIDATLGEKMAYAIGFNPQRIARKRDSERLRRHSQEVQRRESVADMDRLTDLYFRNPSAVQAELLRMQANDPDFSAPAASRKIAERVEKRRFPEDPRREGTRASAESDQQLLRLFQQRGSAPTELQRLLLKQRVQQELGFPSAPSPAQLRRAMTLDDLMRRNPYMTKAEASSIFGS